MKPLVVIIGGPPGTGKTTLGRRLAADLKLPFLHRDGIKERLYDRLGATGDLAWSRRLGQASYDILYYFAEAQLCAGRSHVLESNWTPDLAGPVFRALQARHGFAPIQVLCRTQAGRLYERIVARSASGERHPGHLDALAYREVSAGTVPDREAPLPIGGPVIEVDTTDFERVDYEAILVRIRAAAAQDNENQD